MLRHFFVRALIQSGVNAKVAQTLAGMPPQMGMAGFDFSDTGILGIKEK
jgi:hypothetical protein